MNKKKLIDITQELRELYPKLEKESEEKILEVFQSLKKIQKKSLPQEAFKKKLREKLKTIHSIGVENPLSEIQSSKFSLSLLSWVFASFVFVAGFLYVMQWVLFQNPVTGEALKVQSFTGEQSEDTTTLEPISSDTPDTILKAEDVLFNGLQNPNQRTLPAPDPLSVDEDSSEEVQNSEENTFWDTSVGISSQDTSIWEEPLSQNDALPKDNSDMRISWEDSSSDEIEPVQGALFMELMGSESSLSETFMQDSNDDFAEFCALEGWDFNTDTRVCFKAQNRCTEPQYNSGNCQLNSPSEGNNQRDTPEQESTPVER